MNISQNPSKDTADHSTLPSGASASWGAPQGPIPEKLTPSTESVRQFFCDKLVPLLARCRDFSFDRNGGAVPEGLANLLADQLTRAMAWSHLENGGLQGRLTQQQGHALVAGLLEHVAQDTDFCWPGFLAVTAGAAEARDNRLYQKLGEAALSMSPSPGVVFALGEPFASLSTHNVSKESALGPWVELLASRGDGILYGAIVGEVCARLERGDLSSYDHLLAVLCKSPSPEAVQALAEAVIPPAYLAPESPRVKLSAGVVLAVFLEQSVKMLPAAAIVSLVLRGAADVLTLSTVITAALAGAISAPVKLKLMTLEVKEALNAQHSFVAGAPFLHFAEKVYSRLQQQRETRPEFRAVLEGMESNLVLAPHLAGWRKDATPVQ